VAASAAKDGLRGLGLEAIEGLTPRMAKMLYDELGIADVRVLETACREGRVSALPGFGIKREHQFLDRIAALAGAGRQPLAQALPLARAIETRLRALPGVVHACAAGSVRRCRNTVGDLDFVVAARNAAAVSKAFASLPEVARVSSLTKEKTLVQLHSGIYADLRIVPEASFGAALLCFTGNAAHYEALRRIARSKRLRLNEHGLFRGHRPVVSRTEVDVYQTLDLNFVPPELREDTGEIEAAHSGDLPGLIGHGDLRGDLRVYTDARSGATIESMARAARAAGLEYVALSVRPRTRARDSEAARVLEHARAVRAQSARWPGLRLLTSAEVPVREDGTLELPDSVLAQLDVVSATIRDRTDQRRAGTMRRIVRATENPHVDIFVLPALRRRAGRMPVAIDMDGVIAAAQRTGTVLEIDASCEPLEFDGAEVRKALKAGVRLVIDSGADEPDQLSRADELGIAVAKRGWARRCDVLNALTVDQCLAHLKDGWASKSSLGSFRSTGKPAGR
jgi:DNA polymerase (family 10)